MSAPAVSPAVRQAQDYLAAVEHELADLAVDDRSALLEDLALHLEALAAEDDDRPIAVRLGPPAAYAADLRVAAGLPPRGGAPRLTTARLRQRLVRVLALPGVMEILRLVRELRPAWWLLRGYLLVLVPCLLDRDGGVRDFPVPAPFDSPVLGVALVVLAIVGSVALGRRALSGAGRVLVAVGGAVLAVLPLVIWQSASASGFLPGSPSSAGIYPAAHDYRLLSRYGPVTNVLPYAADGTPLVGVLLFDQDGRPLKVDVQQWWADGCARVLAQPRAADGVPVPNSFPLSYVLDPAGTDSSGTPVPAGQCVTDVPRPDVPLPVFPDEDSAQEDSAQEDAAPGAPASPTGSGG